MPMALPRAAAAAGLILTALLAGGCMMPDQLQTLQTDVAQVRAQMEAAKKQNQAALSDIEAVKAATAARDQADRERAAEAKRQMDSIRGELRSLNSRLDEIQHRLSGLSSAGIGGGQRPAPPQPKPEGATEGASGSASAGPSASAPPAGVAFPGSPTSDPARTGSSAPASAGAASAPAALRPAAPVESSEDLFNAAYADYSKGNYTPAILGFEDYLKRFPDSEKADDAYYWIGLCHYDQGEYPEAIATFDRLIQEHPDGDKVPGAYLKKGLSLLEMNRTAQGVVQLQHLIEKFPRSEEARIARDRLKELGVKP